MMLIPTKNIAAVLCIPENHLLRLLARKKRLTRRQEGVLYVDVNDAADAVKCPRPVMDLITCGKDWLLTEEDIKGLYGCTEDEIRRIAGAPLFNPYPFPPVYRASIFIEWLKNLDPADRARIKEGNKHGSGPAVSRRGLR